METVEYVIATYHEVALKGGNRGWFERVLLRNIRASLRGLPVRDIAVPARIVVRFAAPVPWPDVYARLATVFGINNIIPVARTGASYEDLERWVGEHLGELDAASFAVRCQRSDKRFPMTSEEVCRRLGAFIKGATGLPVDLEHPGATIHVLVQNDGIYTFRARYPGPGGLPMGTSGRALVLLSGGIDSPAAAYLTMKRGVAASFVHFHSAPYTSDASVRKVEAIVQILARYQGGARLWVVPFADCQREIVTACPEALRVVLYRRMMLRVAARIARRTRCLALVTGESLNQVASQTLENLATIDRVAHMPVLRPLVGLDKEEIIRIAERAGTFELSIQPHQDCCSFLQPRHPATRTSDGACQAAEAALDVEGWARRLQHAAEDRRLVPAPWGTVAVAGAERGT